MPSYMVTLKENAPAEQLAKAKEEVVAKGGKITHEYALVKGFTVEYPADHVETLKSNDHLEVEEDKGVKTQ